MMIIFRFMMRKDKKSISRQTRHGRCMRNYWRNAKDGNHSIQCNKLFKNKKEELQKINILCTMYQMMFSSKPQLPSAN